MDEQGGEPVPAATAAAEHLLAAAACSPDAVVTIDVGGRVTWLNAKAEQLLGWSAEQLIGRPAAALVPADRSEEARLLDLGLPVLAEVQTLETERLHRSGDRVPVALRAGPLKVRGRRVGSVAVMRDMSAELAIRADLRHARQLADARFEQSVLAMASLSPDGTVTHVNRALCAVSGYAPDQLVGRSYAEFMLADDVEDAAQNQARVRDGDLQYSRRQRMLRKADGTYLETLVSLSALYDDTGRVARLEVAVEDVSAVLAAERALRASEKRWRALALRSSDVSFLADADGRLLFVSPSVGDQFDYDGKDMLGQLGFAFFHPDDVALARAEWSRAVSQPGVPVTFRGRARHGDGTWRWIEETATSWIGDPDIGAVVANVTDVTALVQAEQRLAAADARDPLTGLLTRHRALAHLEGMLRADSPAVVVVDVARFRDLNAAHGHAVGDELLAELSRRLVAAVTEGDQVARIGGDRFAVLLLGAEGAGDVAAAVERLTRAALDPVALRDGNVKLDVHIGAVTAIDSAAAADAADVLAVAEAALREAKKTGRVHVHVHDPASPSRLAERSRTVGDLRRALSQGELIAHFQPVIELASGRAVGAEALVRWQHPERGLLPPAAFIGAAEDSGLITELGAQVLEQACRAAARWSDADVFGGPFQVAVNLSVRQMARPQVVDLVRDTLAATGAAASHLTLEVTESAVMDDIETTKSVLGRLRELGVALAVDDFGTGYSSLTYLREFPVTSLKIDRSFVAGLPGDADDAAIVASVIQLADAIGLGCVAEGVETAEQAEWLSRAGCPLAQGYLWSPAIDADALTVWLRSRPAPPPPRIGKPATGRRRARAVAVQPVTTAAAERILQLQNQGASLHTIAAALNAEGLLTADGPRWHPRSVARAVADRSGRGRSPAGS